MNDHKNLCNVGNRVFSPSYQPFDGNSTGLHICSFITDLAFFSSIFFLSLHSILSIAHSISLAFMP